MTVQQMGLANWFESGKRTTGHGFQFAISGKKTSTKRSRLTVACEKPVASSFLVADSDDWFPPNALETFAEHWRLIPDGEREQFAGVCGLCVYENGRVVGDRFPGGDWIDSNPMEIRYRYRVRGEKWGFVRTDILRHVRFPEHILGHVPESVVWNRIGARYKTRYINEVVRVYVQETGEKVTQLARMRDPAKVAPGMVYWKRMILSDEISWFGYAPVSFFSTQRGLYDSDFTCVVDRVSFGRHPGSDGRWL